MGTRRDLSVTIESHDKDKNYCSGRSFHNISMWSWYLQHMVQMKYKCFVIKPRTSTKAEEVGPGIEVTQDKYFVMCHATSKYNYQVILARGGWVETHPRHSQLVAPGIVCLPLHNERILFFSLSRKWYRQLIMKENSDRVSALRATSSLQKVENYFCFFMPLLVCKVWCYQEPKPWGGGEGEVVLY